MNNTQLKQLKKHIEQSGGATLASDGAITALNAGFMVSLAGFEKKTSLKRLNKRTLNKYLKEAKKRNAYAGLWLDNDILYIDISACFMDKAQAIYAGVKNKQLAIYDNAQQVSIYLK